MLRKLILEIHRRSLWQVLGIYAVGSWVAFEVISELSDVVGLPAWVPAFTIVLFLVGLPIVLATAFVQEGLPGQRPTAAPSPEDAAAADPTLIPSLADTATTPDRRRADAEARAHAARHDMWLTWRRALLSGIVAFLLLGLTAGGYMGMRNAGIGPFGSLVASGALDERAPVLLAGFDDASGDTLLADALTAAFRLDFAETGIVTLIEPRQVGAALQRMGRPVDQRLTQALALEVAARENIPAVITGEVRSAAGSTMLTVALLSSDDGAPLASFRETARDSADILPALDRLSKKLREKLGESLRTVRAGKPLEEVTTPSLEALRRYTRGVEALDVQRDFTLAITLLKEAVALDSTFGMAWRKLAVAYGNMGNAAALQVDAATRAYRLSDRLTDSERYHAVGFYHMNVSGDIAQAIATYRAGLDAFPEKNFSLHNNLAVAYQDQRDWLNAEAAARTLVDRDSMLVVGYVNLIFAQIAQRDFAAADETVALMERRHGASPDVARMRVSLDVLQGHHARADSILQAVLTEVQGPMRANVLRARGTLRLVRGQVRESEQLVQQSTAVLRQQGVAHAWLNEATSAAWTDLGVRLDPVAGAARLDRALAENDFAALPPPDRDYFNLIALYATSGNPARARSLLEEYQRVIPPGQRGTVHQELTFARGQVALAEGRIAEGLELLRAGDAIGNCTFCGAIELGFAFDALGQPDSAAVHYERYLSTPHLYRGWSDGGVLARMHERLADIYDARGETQKAILHAARFTELWQDADPELQPRVRAKQEMIARLRQS